MRKGKSDLTRAERLEIGILLDAHRHDMPLLYVGELKSVFSIVGKIRIRKPSCSVGLFLLLFPPCSPYGIGRSSYSSLRRQSAFLYTPPREAAGGLILNSGSTSRAARTWSTAPIPPRWARPTCRTRSPLCGR